MQIQVNTDNHIAGHEGLAARIAETVEDTLAHNRDRITRVEVHVSDENARKPGTDDKRCVIEARLEGHKPLAASHNAGTIDAAVNGAAEKLARQISSTLGKQRDK
ncbi:MAG: HPF/RaiA family ribosome-associated protein [Candidatus Hydrogenedentes bacterium]|nr:HPF/RaiA family ribosome-associated protein [Candidatus Hydrogenedentota bacterium]